MGQACRIAADVKVPGRLGFVYADGAAHGELIEMASGMTGAGFGLI